MLHCALKAACDAVRPRPQWRESPHCQESRSPAKRNENNSLTGILPWFERFEVASGARYAMHANQPAVTLLRFGAFEADVQTGELRKQGKRVRLQDQPFQLLVMLLEAPGQVVTRDELRSKLWPQTTVDFDHGLNKAISKIREALGDSPEHPRFVETVARRGYRFLADVAVVGGRRAKPLPDDPAYEGSPAFAPALPITHQKKRPSSLVRLLFGLALVAAFAISWVFYHEIYSSPAIRSLAVLPLENVSGDGSQDYFADGMTDALITRLAQISTLREISRRSVMT